MKLLIKKLIIICLCVATASEIVVSQQEIQLIEQYGPEYQIEKDKNSGPGIELN